MSLVPHFLSGYSSDIYNNGHETTLVMLVAFVVTFILARTYTRIARIRGWRSAFIAGVHTHHLVFGVIGSFSAAALEFTLQPTGAGKLILAALFGGGAALVLDEFALAVHLQDVYWEKEGRKSVDAVVIGAAFGLLFLLRTAPFGHSNKLPFILLTTIQIINLAFVVSAALKGKIYLAIFGVFIPILAILGALRLAEPDSIWARNFYDRGGDKMRISLGRYAEYERVWRPRKEFLWDIVGGKAGRPIRRKRH